MNETLEHHGILGMKWGVRRYQNKDGTWTEEGKEHRAESEDTPKQGLSETVEVKANSVFTKDELDVVKNNQVDDPELIELMLMEVIDATGYAEGEFQFDSSWEDELEKFKKDPHNYTFRFKGYEDETKHSDDSPEDFLAHHGILGMKWGIRRYQNSDGSLTAAGRKRYGVDENDGQSSGSNSDTTTRTPAKSASEMTDQELNQALNRLRMEQQYNELTGAKSSNQYQNQQNFQNPPSNTGNLSNAELQAYITRLDMEKRYAQLTAPPPKEVSAGRKFFNEVVGPAINQVAKAYIVASLSKVLGLKGDGDNGGNNNNNNGGKKNNNDDSQYKSIKKELSDLKSMMGSQRKQDNGGNQKKESSRDSGSESGNDLPEPRSTETQKSNTHRDSIFSAARDAARNVREQRREREQEREQRRQESREKRERRNAQRSAFLDGLDRQTGGSVDPVTKSYKTRAQSYFDSYLNNMGR